MIEENMYLIEIKDDIGEYGYNLIARHYQELDSYEKWKENNYNIAYKGCEPSYIKIYVKK